MAQEQFGLYTQLERRQAPRLVIDRTALSLTLGLAEGIAAGAIVLGTALAYHGFLSEFSPQQLPVSLYAFHALLVGLVYSGLSSVTASRYLDRMQRQHASLADSALAWTVASGLALLFGFIAGLADDLSRATLTGAYALGLPLLLGLRGAIYSRVAARIQAGRLQYQKVAIVGNQGDVARFLLRGDHWRSGYQLADTIHIDTLSPEGDAAPGVVADRAQNWIARGIHYVVFVGDIGDLDKLELLSNELKRFAINVVCAPATSNDRVKFLDVVAIGANNALKVLGSPMSDAEVMLKRAFDVLGAAVGLVLLSPILAIVALAIRLDSRGPVFFLQARRGFNGKTFLIWKFRSMHVTESGLDMTQAQAGDPRVTRVGRVMRAWSIDELPQLINVLWGDMSLVGPRPHALVHDDELSLRLASYAHRQRIKPGITGWAQVNGFRGQTVTFEQIEGRTIHDLHYIENWTIFLDIWIILLTIFSKKTRTNAL
ncbi:MAG TPA: exopolysaccharide biosynthesis polyprenyl glycosylphosphotransferase [Devosiaceae bacterium]|jgi:exopolysaccharide biosynthesis polyprenyl glycosylphosphotransferase|nr:exopolysaccharide biosynthesis polyprenyl glycosylphosphotransferase [Devosiaceae bacterium]